MTDSPQSRFRLPHWSWFLLATVLLVITGIGLIIWMPWHRERRVIQEIESLGGRVKTETGGPDWLRQLVGNDRMKEFKVFERVSDCDLEYSRITDADVIYLGRLANLQTLIIGSTAVTDSGLAHLSGLTNLNVLCLWDTKVTGVGFVHLSSLPSLKLLNLGNTAVTDSGVAYLGRLTHLEYLVLDDTAVTNAGLTHLSGCTRLEHISARGSAVTKKGFEELQKALPDCDVDY